MVELLAIVQAEQAAEALLKAAQSRREDAISAAMKTREFKLANIRPPEVTAPTLKPLNPNLEKIKQQASRNKQRAIAMILEELNAS